MQRLLFIEDDQHIRAALKLALEDEGYEIIEASDGIKGLSLFESTSVDLVLLDLRLPDLSGFEVCRMIRSKSLVPIIIVTAQTDTHDLVAGLEAGADDYVTKPFHLEEVLARLRALVRRASGHASSDLVCGPVRIDTRTSRVSVNDVTIKLTSLEYRLISYLLHHAGRVVSRTELVEHLYDQDFDRDSNTIEVFVGRLRKKLGVDAIRTIRGLGYVLEPPGTDMTPSASAG